MNILSLLVIIPLLTLLALFTGKGQRFVRTVVTAGFGLQLVCAVAVAVVFLQQRAVSDEAMLLCSDTVWYAPFNIHYTVGVDGISVVMLLLSAVVAFAGVFSAWNMERDFFVWYSLLAVGVFGYFISLDLFTMFMFYEIALIPMFLLIGVWGTGKKVYAATKLTLMLMGGSAFLLTGILGIYFTAGATTMNIMEISQLSIPMNHQYWIFCLTFIGFGVLGALFPFHTWSPDGHAAAPTSVSMLHAGVLMKLGGYGCFRVAIFLMPQAAQELSWIFLILTGIGVVYGAYGAVVQTDLKYMNAYSSVSHCSLVLFAILMLNRTAMTGAVLQMLSLRPHPHARHPRDGRPDAYHALRIGLLRDSRFRFARPAGIQRVRGRNDRFHRFVRTCRPAAPRTDDTGGDLHRGDGRLYPAYGRQDTLRSGAESRPLEAGRCALVRAFLGRGAHRLHRGGRRVALRCAGIDLREPRTDNGTFKPLLAYGFG